ELRGVVQRFEADRGSLNRRYTITFSPTRIARVRDFCTGWLAALQKLESAKLSPEGRTDYDQLKKTIEGELKQLDQQARAQAEIAPLVPFAPAIINLEESRRRMEKVDSPKAAGLLNELKKQLDRTSKAVEAALKSEPGASGITLNKEQVSRVAETTTSLRNTLKNWFNFYNAYDPLFTWWLGEPYKQADQALQSYAS